VNRVAISIQTLNGRKDVYLRKEVGTMNKRAILEAVEAMLDDQPGHTIGRTAPKTFTRGGHNKKVLRGDEDEQVKEAVSGITEAVFA
jgi:hypothetical protein